MQDSKPIGYHVMVEKTKSSNKDGEVFTTAKPIYICRGVGDNAREAFLDSDPIDKELYIKQGSEGEPYMVGDKCLYFIHLDYVLGFNNK